MAMRTVLSHIPCSSPFTTPSPAPRNVGSPRGQGMPVPIQTIRWNMLPLSDASWKMSWTVIPLAAILPRVTGDNDTPLPEKRYFISNRRYTSSAIEDILLLQSKEGNSSPKKESGFMYKICVYCSLNVMGRLNFTRTFCPSCSPGVHLPEVRRTTRMASSSSAFVAARSSFSVGWVLLSP